MDTRFGLHQKTQEDSRFSRFQLDLISRSAALVTYGDTCKETCKLPAPLPNSCKLECHSGSPFTDMQEEVPASLVG